MTHICYVEVSVPKAGNSLPRTRLVELRWCVQFARRLLQVADDRLKQFKIEPHWVADTLVDTTLQSLWQA